MGALTQHIEQVRLVHEAGFHGAYIGHHSSYGTNVWLPPFETLARLSAEVSGMALGTAIALAPLFHPTDLAERGALLDTLCGGRFTLGLAPGWWPGDAARLGYPHQHRFGRFDETVQVIQRLWLGESVDFHGRHYQLHDEQLKLLPVQSPRPPLWLGAMAKDAIDRVARRAEPAMGDTWLGSSQTRHEALVSQTAYYRQRLLAHGKTWRSPPPVLRNVVLGPTRARALNDIAPSLAANDPAPAGGTFDVERFASGRLLAGSPSQVVDELQQLCQTLDIDHLIIRIQWVGTPQATVMRTLETFAEHVAPHFPGDA